MDLMRSLMVHAPGNVLSDWALYNNAVPSHEWPGEGPEVEIGLAMLKGKTAAQVMNYVKHFTNPELLDEIARTDDRVRVAQALVENGGMTVEGYRTLLQKHDRRPSIVERIYTHNTSLGIDEYRELRVGSQQNCGIFNDAKSNGLLPTLEKCVELEEPFGDLMESYTGSPRWNTPSATHDEILAAFEFLYRNSQDAGALDHLPMPTGEERWITEVPGAAEQLLRTIVDHAPTWTVGRAINLRKFLDNLPKELTGPVPDVAPFIARGDLSSGYVLNLARTVLDEWFKRRPASGDELNKLEATLNTMDKAMAGYRRSDTTPLFVTPETLLLPTTRVPETFSLLVERPAEAILDVLEQEGRSASDRLSDMRMILRSAVQGQRYTDKDRGRFIARMVPILNRTLLEVPTEAARSSVSELLTVQHYLQVVPALDAPVIGEVYSKWILSSPHGSAEAGCTADQHQAIRDQIVERMSADDCTDQMWRNGAMHLITSESTGSDAIEMVIDLSYERFFRVLLSPTLVGDTNGYHPRRYASEMLKAASKVAMDEYESGEPAKFDELLKILSSSSDLSSFALSLRTQLYRTERALMSGEIPLQEVLHDTESHETIAKIFEKAFGSDTTLWQLATELAAEWDGPLPELLEVVEASS